MRRLKLLIAVLLGMLIFLLGYGQSQAGDEELFHLFNTPVTGSTVEVPPEKETVVYTWGMTLENLANKVNALVGNYSISYAIVKECTEQIPDGYTQCIKSAVGVANAESTLFTKGMSPSNNGRGLMYKGKKRKFSSVEESVQVWVSLYKKNNWGKRTSGKAWVGTYCMSECTYWAKNYESAVEKLGLD